MAGKVLEIYWQQITQQQLPFPTSRAITSLPSGDGSIKNSGISDYLGPEFDGIYLKTNGLSGASERWYIECTSDKIYDKFKVYINFGNNWYVYEIQVWGPGTWVIENPSGQPRIPNQLMIGAVVYVYDDFPPGESNPLFPPPVHNPFEPDLLIEGRQDEWGDYWNRAWGRLISVTDVTIDAVFVYHEGILINVTASDLLAGYLFDEIGDYEIIINYHYKNWPGEVLHRLFIVVTRPKFALAQFSARKTAEGTELKCGYFDFGLYDENDELVYAAKNQGHLEQGSSKYR